TVKNLPLGGASQTTTLATPPVFSSTFQACCVMSPDLQTSIDFASSFAAVILSSYRSPRILFTSSVTFVVTRPLTTPLPLSIVSALPAPLPPSAVLPSFVPPESVEAFVLSLSFASPPPQPVRAKLSTSAGIRQASRPN